MYFNFWRTAGHWQGSWFLTRALPETKPCSLSSALMVLPKVGSIVAGCWRGLSREQLLAQDSSRACHLHTCCPLDSFIAVQCLSSSSPELFRPKEIQPIISFLFMLRLLYTDSIRVTSESWNKATWKTKVSLYTGFGCPLRVDVLHLDISWPMEFSSVNLTYVSEGRKPTYHKYHLRQMDSFLIINAKIR